MVRLTKAGNASPSYPCFMVMFWSFLRCRTLQDTLVCIILSSFIILAAALLSNKVVSLCFKLGVQNLASFDINGFLDYKTKLRSIFILWRKQSTRIQSFLDLELQRRSNNFLIFHLKNLINNVIVYSCLSVSSRVQ